MNTQTKILGACPGCRGNQLEEVTRVRTFMPRKKPVEVHLLATRCRNCGTEFETGRQHDENLQRLAKRREDPNYDGILLGEDILRLRMRYGLTQRDASRIFGAGKIAFSRYENEVTYPDEAMTNLLRLAIANPSNIKWLADQKGVTLPLWEARCAEEQHAKVLWMRTGYTRRDRHESWPARPAATPADVVAGKRKVTSAMEVTIDVMQTPGTAHNDELSERAMTA